MMRRPTLSGDAQQVIATAAPWLIAIRSAAQFRAVRDALQILTKASNDKSGVSQSLRPSLVITDQRTRARELVDPVPPQRTVPVIFDD
jgi:hypothetical protein